MNLSRAKVLPHEMAILLVLAGLQFAHIVDFMILMPLGPKLMRTMSITSHQFGALVSVYTFTAGITNLLGAFLLDRYDRKKSTLILFAGFVIGTVACGLAPNYEFLFVARSVAGAFGGLVNAAVLAIVGDYIPYQRRARAMGVIMASFSVASIVGVPLGLWLANQYDWHAPFFLVGALSLVFATGFYWLLPPLTRHMESGEPPATLRQSFATIGNILTQSGPRRALSLIALLMLSQFAIVPFLTTFYVLNVRFPESQIPLIYMVGGALTVVTSPLVGKLADRYGRAKIFAIFSSVVTLPLILITNLQVGASVGMVLTIQGFFFVAANGRFVPAMTMITSVVPSRRRGTFMSLTSCVQQVSAGAASYLGGLLITEGPGGVLKGYNHVGWISVVFNMIALGIGLGLERRAFIENDSKAPVEAIIHG